jgi:hypothetical protein
LTSLLPFFARIFIDSLPLHTKNNAMPTLQQPTKTCFVCKAPVEGDSVEYNKKTHLPVCMNCKDTKAEKDMEDKLLDSLAEGFVCGCI